MESRSRSNQQILDEAAEWFVDFREGDVDATAQIRFNHWLRRSPEHIKTYLEVAALWADVPNLATKEEIDVQALIAFGREETNVIPIGTPGNAGAREQPNASLLAGNPPDAVPSSLPALAGRHRHRQLFRPVAVAASLLILCFGAAGTAWVLLQRGVYATEVGEQRSIMLDDGSTVELNAKSRMRVRLSAHLREVDLLDGQALFRVAKDRTRPFIVRSGGTLVRVVGTQFDVYRRASGTTVTVVEGEVAVSLNVAPQVPLPNSKKPEAPDSGAVWDAGAQVSEMRLLVSAGQQTIVTAQAATAPKTTDTTIATAWTQRQIVFDGTALSEVVEEFNRYNRKQMVVGDPTLRGVRVSGVFSSTNPTSLLRFLREQVQLAVVEGESQIQISRKN